MARPDRNTRTARNLMATASTARDATALCVYVCAQADGQSVHTMHVLHGDPTPEIPGFGHSLLSCVCSVIHELA